MSETMSTNREHPPDAHDHAWRRSKDSAVVGIPEYRCDLCSLTWSMADPAH